MIIDNDYETLTVKDKDNKIKIRNIDEYNLMKYQDFDGDRIIVNLNKNCSVIETFDEGIFNIRFKNYRMQLRDKIEVCKRLKFAIETHNDNPIKELLLDNVKDSLDKDFLIMVLKGYGERVKITDKEILIDEWFKVDMNGQAYFKNIHEEFKAVCIVANKTGQMNYKLKHELGKFDLSFKTLEIYFKVLFLLFPNKEDSVFMNQLPKKLKGIINGK